MSRSKLRGLKLKQLEDSIKEKMPIPVDRLGQRLKDIREALGITQKQLAKRLNVKQPMIARIEKNVSSCSLETISKIAKALECEFMGAIASNASLEDIIRRRAEIAAKRLLNKTMEKPMPTADAYKHQFRRYVENFVSNPGTELWDD
jgi:transcriptional regulator with XRE-family HTH domain